MHQIQIFLKSPLSNQALLGPSQHQCVIRVHIGMGRNQPVQFKSLKKNPMLPNTLAKYPEYLGPQISEVQKSPGSGSIDSSRYVSGNVIALKIMFSQFLLELLFLPQRIQNSFILLCIHFLRNDPTVLCKKQV